MSSRPRPARTPRTPHARKPCGPARPLPHDDDLLALDEARGRHADPVHAGHGVAALVDPAVPVEDVRPAGENSVIQGPDETTLRVEYQRLDVHRFREIEIHVVAAGGRAGPGSAEDELGHAGRVDAGDGGDGGEGRDVRGAAPVSLAVPALPNPRVIGAPG